MNKESMLPENTEFVESPTTIINETTKNIPIETDKPKKTEKPISLKKYIVSSSNGGGNIECQQLYKLMDQECQNNKSAIWSKLDKTQKLQKLHAYAEKYGHEQKLPNQDIRTLKTFLSTSLDKNKLQKVKEVIYNKEKREIDSIPALLTTFNEEEKQRHFTLKNLDANRVSTLNSLTVKNRAPIKATSTTTTTTTSTSTSTTL